MQNKLFKIDGIPAVLWGENSERTIIAVHGNMSSKTDAPIEILAETALRYDYQVLSFDLPEHGDRKNESTPCKIQCCINDLAAVMRYARARWNRCSLFANSMGAYFSLLAYQNEPLEKAWFLSPVVDMQDILETMMAWSHITEKQLEKERVVCTPAGQNLYWDDYCYVREYPIRRWNVPTNILYGDKDDLCKIDILSRFCEQFPCTLEIARDAVHYFHTEDQLQLLRTWLEKTV